VPGSPEGFCLERSSGPPSREEWAAEYLASACPVGTNPLDVSPEGVADLLGGVREWVDSPAATMHEGRIVLKPHTHCAKGFTWASPANDSNLEDILEIPSREPQTRTIVGFRCALNSREPR